MTHIWDVTYVAYLLGVDFTSMGTFLLTADPVRVVSSISISITTATTIATTTATTTVAMQ